MDTQEPIAERIDAAAATLRLLADLLLAGPSLAEIDRGALARVLHDLAQRLERTEADREAGP